jgi:hypothetical protein
VTEAARLPGTVSLFFLSHHSWAAVVLLGVVALVVYYLDTLEHYTRYPGPSGDAGRARVTNRSLV